MAIHSTLSSLFCDIATAIRNQTGGQDLITADNFPTAISNISSGCTATSSDILLNKTALSGGQLLTGTIKIYNNEYSEMSGVVTSEELTNLGFVWEVVS